MTTGLLFFIALFMIIMQSAIPYLIKPTIVFGVTIPTPYTKDNKLSAYKKLYMLIISVSGALLLSIFSIWALLADASEDKIALMGIAAQFAILFLGMILYLYFHAKTTKLKRQNNWGADLKQVRITDIAIRSADEMLPWSIYCLPILVTLGLLVYTMTQYAYLPDLIPTHWGIDGQPDAFSEKTPLVAVSSLLILLMMQIMMLAVNEFTKKSGIKINATNKRKSRAQQLSFRKYTSWFLFATVLLMTILLSFLQLTTIHGNIGSPVLLLGVPLGFLVITLVLTALYAFKIGQSGSRLNVDITDEEVEGITNYDDDQYWKMGAFYFNKNDPSIFVEKRFGIGWTINFGQPIGYLILFGPLLVILVISFSL